MRAFDNNETDVASVKPQASHDVTFTDSITQGNHSVAQLDKRDDFENCSISVISFLRSDGILVTVGMVIGMLGRAGL